MLKQDILCQFSLAAPLTVVVRGDCMGAALPDGSMVTLRRKYVYWPGDLIFYFRGDGQLASHRFLGYVWTRMGLAGLTAADRNAQADRPFLIRRVLGKALKIDGKRIRCPRSDRVMAIRRYFSALRHLPASSRHRQC